MCSCPTLSHTSIKSGSNSSWLLQSMSLYTRKLKTCSAKQSCALIIQVPDPFTSEMGKGEVGELYALPHALRMTLLFIYSTWDHSAWAVVFPIVLENIYHHLIWFKQTEYCFIWYISLKVSVKVTPRVKFLRVGAVPAQTCELQLNQRVGFQGDQSDGCSKEGSHPFLILHHCILSECFFIICLCQEEYRLPARWFFKSKNLITSWKNSGCSDVDAKTDAKGRHPLMRRPALSLRSLPLLLLLSSTKGTGMTKVSNDFCCWF